MELPEINQRIKKLVEKHANDNSAKFCRMVGITPSYKLTRLFSVETRNNKYPEPSLDVVRQIAKSLEIDLNFLVFGEAMTNNIVDDERVKYMTTDDKLVVIMKQNKEILKKLEKIKR